MELVRFCNNPLCERCDEHLGVHEVLWQGSRELCPVCYEALVVLPRRPRPRLSARRPVGADGER